MSTREAATAGESAAKMLHYQWAGLDFMVDQAGCPVLIEANRSSHMLWEYLQLYGDQRPFELTAELMNHRDGPACLLWRRCDPLPDADEDACWIARQLTPFLNSEPVICFVEENRQLCETLKSRDGRQVRPGSIFRWWYEIPWSYERSGACVINPNCVWFTVRDKWLVSQTLTGARCFRVPRSFAVENQSQAAELIDEHRALFHAGYVLKPRVGFGGQGVHVADRSETPTTINGNYLLSERITPSPRNGRFWDVRVFVMAGKFLGGVLRTSDQAVTNIFRGGTAGRLDDATSALLEPAALEAVRILDRAADDVHRLPETPESRLTDVDY